MPLGFVTIIFSTCTERRNYDCCGTKSRIPSASGIIATEYVLMMTGWSSGRRSYVTVADVVAVVVINAATSTRFIGTTCIFVADERSFSLWLTRNSIKHNSSVTYTTLRLKNKTVDFWSWQMLIDFWLILFNGKTHSLLIPSPSFFSPFLPSYSLPSPPIHSPLPFSPFLSVPSPFLFEQITHFAH